jgi:adenylate kinase
LNLVLFGPPGAGKGTQSAFLVDRLKMKHISTGDLFRAAIKNGTPLGKEAKSFLDSGKLVPDSVTIGLVKEELGQLKGESFILDGFPRTVAQAVALESLLAEKALRIDKTVFLEVPFKALLDRLTGRRVCKACGAVYHIKTKSTKVAGVCDVCGGEVVQRADDFEDVIGNRLRAYEESTRPLKEHYKSRGPYVEVDGTGSSEDVFERVINVLQVKK